jgi:hypothetical protein
MLKPLYEKISAACCNIVVLCDGEKISEGSGFAINEEGVVFTAAHVVTGRMPFSENDYRDPGMKILVKFPDLPVAEYRVPICGITIKNPAFSKPIQVDQALLFPINPIDFPVEPFTIGMLPELGDEVYLAGYSDELELPFQLDRILIRENKGVDEFLLAMQQGYQADMTGPMIKRGVVGNLTPIKAENSSTGTKICIDVFYVDNSVHSGASGGPIVDAKGQAVGVIVQRATTSASQSSDAKLLVPSGATVGLGLKTLPLMIEAIKKGPNS